MSVWGKGEDNVGYSRKYAHNSNKRKRKINKETNKYNEKKRPDMQEKGMKEKEKNIYIISQMHEMERPKIANKRNYEREDEIFAGR